MARKKNPQVKALSDGLRDLAKTIEDRNREATWWDTLKDELREIYARVILPTMARARLAASSFFASRPEQAPPPPPQASNYNQLLLDQHEAESMRKMELVALLSQTEGYIKQRETSGKKYHFWGRVLQLFGASDETLRGLNIYPASEKLRAAKHLEAAIRYNIDGTVGREENSVDSNTLADASVLEHGSLGKLYSALQAPESGSYNEVRRQRKYIEEQLKTLRAFNLDAPIQALKAVVESTEQQASAESLTPNLTQQAQQDYDARLSNIKAIVAQSLVAYKKTYGYCGTNQDAVRTAHVKDALVVEAAGLHNTLVVRANKAITELGARFDGAKTTIEQKLSAGQKLGRFLLATKKKPANSVPVPNLPKSADAPTTADASVPAPTGSSPSTAASGSKISQDRPTVPVVSVGCFSGTSKLFSMFHAWGHKEPTAAKQSGPSVKP